ncbi:GNAT family N-acetyltransferase, partial [Rhizobium mesoamericanum]|uniref:GNAT family N-acetyltransferase n=1 Tax=Rhizobium mesoamericanum TaxID=1079800 RepID=UPI001FCAEC0F
MTEPFVIRRAELSQAEPLAQFAAHLFRDTYDKDTATSDIDAHIEKNFSVEHQAAEISDPAAAVFLATFDDCIIGYAHVIFGSVNYRSAFLNRIYVDADWRGRGLATELLETVLNEARQRGETRLELTVFEQNARAIAFYKRAGFAVTGYTAFTVGQDVQTDLVMAINVAEGFDT